jgi:TRAP-type mannitol/chloroaromatic compound transport system substrate-binding protein
MLKYWNILLLSAALLAGCQSQSESTTTETTQDAESQVAQTKIYNWKMVTTWSPNFPVFQEGVEMFAQDLAIMSNNRLKVQVFAGGELVPALQTFDAVAQGTVQMGHGAAYYWSGKVPAAQFMSAVPYGLTASGMNAWFYQAGGLELWREMYQPFNVVPYPAGNTGVQMGGWFNKKIESVADLRGLKMRIPGLGGKVLAKAGGTPVLLAGGEIYTALERGTIDAVEWVGPFHDERLGLYRAARYYYYPGWHEPGTTLELIVNKQALESLPADLQKIIEISAMALNQWMYAQFEGLNIQSLRNLAAKPNVEILPFPQEVLSELRRLTLETLAEEAAKDPKFDKIYQAFTAFQADHDAWVKVADRAYYDAP